MSYAGPASRGKRASETRLVATRPPTTPVPTSTLVARDHRAPPDRRRPAVLAAGILIGLAVGAGIALLLAPRSGEDTRDAIVKRGRRLGERGRDVWDDLRDEFRDAIHRRRLARQCRKLDDERDVS